jgi:hypothetical protein
VPLLKPTKETVSDLEVDVGRERRGSGFAASDAEPVRQLGAIASPSAAYGYMCWLFVATTCRGRPPPAAVLALAARLTAVRRGPFHIQLQAKARLLGSARGRVGEAGVTYPYVAAPIRISHLECTRSVGALPCSAYGRHVEGGSPTWAGACHSTLIRCEGPRPACSSYCGGHAPAGAVDP